jgi:hypothetical protein
LRIADLENPEEAIPDKFEIGISQSEIPSGFAKSGKK